MVGLFARHDGAGVTLSVVFLYLQGAFNPHRSGCLLASVLLMLDVTHENQNVSDAQRQNLYIIGCPRITQGAAWLPPTRSAPRR